jgi:hypothetical protein
MMIFAFLFIALALTTVVALVLAVIHVVHGRFQQAGNLLFRLGVGLVLYLAIVALVGLFSPQRVVALGDDRCFDDWCVAVEDVALAQALGQGEPLVQATGTFYVVTLRLSNHARGQDQRASSAAVHLSDRQGQQYDISLEGQKAFIEQNGPVVPLTSLIPVGQSLKTVQVFDLPTEVGQVNLTIEHPVGFSPGLFIIGDEASLLHKPTIVRLP